VIQRLLLDGIHAESSAAAVSREDHLIAFTLTDKTKAALTIPQLAVTRAKVALHPAILKQVPPASGDCSSTMHLH
jgi:hypothetical protein